MPSSAAVLAVVLTLASRLAAGEQGPWFNYCGSNSLDYSTLVASCTNGQTSIDLNGGLANSGGTLVWRANGGYFGSCAQDGGSCNLQYDVLGCNCLDGAGNNPWTTISLSPHVYYDTDTNSLSFYEL